LANILIADDESGIRMFMSKIIQEMGHTVHEAANGKEALEIFKKETIDLSIIDINMPQMDGICYLERAKEIEPTAVVIMMTGLPSAETIIETIEDDGYTYIAKPLKIEQMKDLIERGLVFRKKRLEEAR
jgi:DNA-binding NtrC family response regulator